MTTPPAKKLPFVWASFPGTHPSRAISVLHPTRTRLHLVVVFMMCAAATCFYTFHQHSERTILATYSTETNIHTTAIRLEQSATGETDTHTHRQFAGLQPASGNQISTEADLKSWLSLADPAVLQTLVKLLRTVRAGGELTPQLNSLRLDLGSERGSGSASSAKDPQIPTDVKEPDTKTPSSAPPTNPSSSTGTIPVAARNPTTHTQPLNVQTREQYPITLLPRPAASSLSNIFVPNNTVDQGSIDPAATRVRLAKWYKQESESLDFITDMILTREVRSKEIMKPFPPGSANPPDNAGPEILPYELPGVDVRNFSLVKSLATSGAMPSLDRWQIFSWGFSLACDVTPHDYHFQTEPKWDPSIYVNKIKDGHVVYVRSVDLQKFADFVLPKIPENVRFTLVTGDSILTVPNDLPFTTAHALLVSPKIKLWYTQNLGVYGPRLRPLPVGNDYHTLYIRPTQWQMPRVHPLHQSQLVDYLSEAIPLDKRLIKVHVSFHLHTSDKDKSWNSDGISRASAAQQLKRLEPNHVTFLPRRMNRLDTWKHQLQHAFVATTYGAGLDCHRTWEALQLGHIVLMRHTDHAAFWSMFEGLPVILVTDWVHITPELLHTWHEEWVQKLKNPEIKADVKRRLSLKWWMERIRNGE